MIRGEQIKKQRGRKKARRFSFCRFPKTSPHINPFSSRVGTGAPAASAPQLGKGTDRSTQWGPRGQHGGVDRDWNPGSLGLRLKLDLKVKSRIPADSYPFFCSPAKLPGRGKEVGVSMF